MQQLQCIVIGSKSEGPLLTLALPFFPFLLFHFLLHFTISCSLYFNDMLCEKSAQCTDAYASLESLSKVSA